MVGVHERCGVLIKSSEKGFLWIIAPFWDISDPVILNSPQRKIDTIIILNNHIEGCLPLTSFLAADVRLPSENIYVTNIKNFHDWHPKYEKQKEINDLVTVKQLPDYLRLGEDTIVHNNQNDIIKINWKNSYTQEPIETYVGYDLFFSDEVNFPRLERKQYQFIGNYSLDKISETALHIGQKAMEQNAEKRICMHDR